MSVELAKFGKEEVPAVTSLEVAEAFGKEHRTVLRAIRSLDCSKEFIAHNFVRYSYKGPKGQRPAYVMTRDGFMMLVMGFTGPAAAAIKEAYILQFNAMEKALKDREIARAAGITTRKSLTATIKESGEAERTHGHAFLIGRWEA